MAYRYGNREQVSFLPPVIDDYVGEDHPVRAYDQFVESLAFVSLGIKLDSSRVGNSSYDPRAMLKLLLYGYSYGIRSSRKLERAVHNDLSFIWLVGGLKPDHKTISEFRKNHKSALTQILKQCALLCLKLGLVEGNTLFVDGTKMRANAGIKNAWSGKRCAETIKKLDDRIALILSECEKTDVAESGQDSYVKMPEELQEAKARKEKIESVLKELQKGNHKSINTTDGDCVKVKSIQGTHAGYNAQSVVDEKNGLIVHTDVVSKSNDLDEFFEQIDQANKTLNKKCETACGDAGYANTKELKKVDAQGIKVVVPSKKQAGKKELPPFDKDRFEYDSDKDCYVCPEGNILSRRYRDDTKKAWVYQIASGSLCTNCRHFGVCTKNKRDGRKIRRMFDDDIKRRLEAQYEEPGSREVYKLRAQKVEHPFGHIKRNLGAGHFLLRGRAGVKAEMSMLGTCFNMSRMITLLGVPGLMAKLTAAG